MRKILFRLLWVYKTYLNISSVQRRLGKQIRRKNVLQFGYTAVRDFNNIWKIISKWRRFATWNLINWQEDMTQLVHVAYLVILLMFVHVAYLVSLLILGPNILIFFYVLCPFRAWATMVLFNLIEKIQQIIFG